MAFSKAGAPVVVSKADRELHAKFLLKVGADDIVYPERDMAQRTAVRYSSNKTMEYVELSPEYAVFEFIAPHKWAGKTLRVLDVRGKYRIHVIASKEGDKIIPIYSADTVFGEGEHLLAVGSRDDMAPFVEGKV